MNSNLTSGLSIPIPNAIVATIISQSSLKTDLD